EASVETSSIAANDSEEIELEGDEILESAPVAHRVSGAPPPPPDSAASGAKDVAPAPPAVPAESVRSTPEKAPAPAAPKAAKRKRPWFEDFFSDDYLRTVRTPTHREVARECDAIERMLGLKAGSTLLDLG